MKFFSDLNLETIFILWVYSIDYCSTIRQYQEPHMGGIKVSMLASRVVGPVMIVYIW